MTHASVVGTLSPGTWGVSVGGVDRHSGLVLGLMSGQVTGTARSGTVGPTTSLADRAASSVVHSRMMLVEALMTCHALEVQASVVIIVLGGSLEIGFALGEFIIHTFFL